MVEAHGEVLFAPGTALTNWKIRFSKNIISQVSRAAPRFNSSTRYPQRTYRPHPGPHLKDSFRANTKTDIKVGGGVYYIAVGSRSPYAIYVDQGTGVYAGRGEYVAKVLPPFTEGGHTLYERDPRDPDRVTISGQRGQFFFKEGLDNAFQIMRLRSVDLPVEGISGLSKRGVAFPENLFGSGRTPNDAGFQARLRMWREWRDEHYARQVALSEKTAEKNRERKESAKDRKPTRKNEDRKPTRKNDEGRKFTRAEVEAGITKFLRELGIPDDRVRNIVPKPDGTFTFEFKNVRGIWVQRSGRWRD